MSSIAVTDPRTGVVVELFDVHTPDQVEERLAAAARAAKLLRDTTFAQRATWLRNAADVLIRDRDDIARDMVLEMGKPVTQALAEVDKCAAGMHFYAERAERMLDNDEASAADATSAGASRAWTRWEPLGLVLAVMPWNFPLWQAVRFLAPALMAANAGVLKHASNVPRSALRLERVIAEGGFPASSFTTLLIGSAEVERVLRDPRVQAVTLTGSEAAGRAVAAIAGDEVKPSLLELGGSDAFVVLASADLEASATTAVTARCQNNGQSCIAAKRFIVESSIYDTWVDRFVAGMRAQRVGDPLDPDTQIGPLVNEAGRDEIHDLVTDAVGKGATTRCGGEIPDGPGWFYPPTVITDVTPEMRVFDEEAFGPVAIVLRAVDEIDALRLANATTFGLGSSVWTQDSEQQQRFISGLQAGSVFVNGMVASHPALPFGGIKRSGYGRELADLGITAFCNAKTVWVA